MGRFLTPVLVLLVSGCLWAAVGNAADGRQLPDRVYACQVMTKEGVYGLVNVQADSEDKAMTSAVKSTAWKMGGGRSPAVSVVECVDSLSGEFKDSAFDAFRKTLIL